MTNRQYCSEHNPEEPLAGTAATVDVWLLLEYRPTWRARAESDNELTEDTRRWLADAQAELLQAGFKSRLSFVRQPEVERSDTRLLVGVHDALIELAGEGYGFLQELNLLDIVGNPMKYPRLSEPAYFVCTNGQRDLCCARFGLPTYRALRDAVSERVWQITHLGGHRFAPNVLVLPQGIVYGNVRAEEVVEFMGPIEAGEEAFRYMRGRCRYPAHVQAAEIYLGRSNLKLLHVDGEPSGARVTFTTGHELLEVSVRRSAEPLSVRKSCGEDAEDVYPYYSV